MAELQVHAPVPARWRILFAALLVLAFWFAGWTLMRKDEVSSPPENEGDGLDAKIRLQTAAIAFSSGKMAPRVLILTDRPEFYEKEEAAYPEFRFFQYGPPQSDPALRFRQHGLHVFDPAAIPGWGLGGPGQSFSGITFSRHRGSEPEKVFDRTLEDELGEFHLDAAFDVVLLDCAFPDRFLSRKLRLFSPLFFEQVKSGLMNTGGVLAVVLPPDRTEDSACVLAILRHTFGNAGAFCFGKRVILASGVDAEPNFALDELNTTAELAGYYSQAGGVPVNAISLILDEDYSDSIPAGLLETSDDVRFPRVCTPFSAVFARAELKPRLTQFLPRGFPLQTVCAWVLGILLAVYPFLRYFISWKPVHKQAFRTFEDMFCLTGALSLFLMFAHEAMPDRGIRAALLLFILAFLFYAALGKYRQWFKAGNVLRNPYGRFLFGLLALLAFGLAFFLPPAGFPTEVLALCGLAFAALPVRARMNEPVQPGPAIPLAFAIGVAASLTVFAASLFFPLGPFVFAAVICGSRLVFLDN